MAPRLFRHSILSQACPPRLLYDVQFTDMENTAVAQGFPHTAFQQPFYYGMPAYQGGVPDPNGTFDWVNAQTKFPRDDMGDSIDSSKYVGFRKPRTPAAKFCGHCGYQIVHTLGKFCSRCGAHLDLNEPLPSALDRTEASQPRRNHEDSPGAHLTRVPSATKRTSISHRKSIPTENTAMPGHAEAGAGAAASADAERKLSDSLGSGLHPKVTDTLHLHPPPAGTASEMFQCKERRLRAFDFAVFGHVTCDARY